MTFTGLRLGWRLGLSRLSVRRLAWLALLTVGFTAAVAAAERFSAPLQAPSRTLHALFGVILPLAGLGFVAMASGGERLDLGTWAVARFGWSRSEIALGSLLSSGLAMLVTSALAVTLGLVITYHGHAGLVADLAISLPVALLAGWGHFAWLSFGATFLAKGRGRWLAFGLDLIFGATGGVFALPFPRGHIRNLLGGEPVLEMSQTTSSLLLALLALAWSVAAVRRTGR